MFGLQIGNRFTVKVGTTMYIGYLVEHDEMFQAIVNAANNPDIKYSLYVKDFNNAPAEVREWLINNKVE